MMNKHSKAVNRLVVRGILWGEAAVDVNMAMMMTLKIKVLANQTNQFSQYI